MGCEMSNDRQALRIIVAIGLCVGLAGGAGQARAEEGQTFWTGVRQGIALGFQYELRNLGLDVTSGSTPSHEVRVHDVIVDRNLIRRKIASEEFILKEGVTLHPSRSSTLQHGVSLSRSFELLIGGGIEVGANGGVQGGVNAGMQAGANAGIAAALKADIGARVADMLSNEIQESSSIGMVTELDGNVLEKARVDWYAHIRPGKAILQANGIVRELPFEYIVGYEPDTAVTPRRRSAASGVRLEDALPAQRIVDSSLPRFGRVTAVSKEWPRLFEARFDSVVIAAKGDKLPMYRGRLDPKCIGCCKVVAVRDCQVVAECEGFTPQVGDMVGRPVAPATGPAR